MTVVFLVRHGESESNILQILDDDINSKYHLTESGKGQVEYAAAQLADIRFDGVISSPILRTRETAQIIADKLKLDVKIDPRLMEAGQGPFSGMNYNQLLPLPRGVSGQEDWHDIIKRFKSLFSELKGSYILVSHALPIKATISHYLGIPDEPSSFGIDIKLASISAIDLSKDQVLCVASLRLSDETRKRMTGL